MLALVLNFGVDVHELPLLLGSFFMPLLGVLVADWLLAGCPLHAPSTSSTGRAGRRPGFVAWLAGFCLYQWLSPVGPRFWTRLVARTHPGYVTFTASLPSFAVAFLLTLVLTLASRAVARRDRTSIA